MHRLDRAVDEHGLHVAPFAAEFDALALIQRADVEPGHALLAFLQRRFGLRPAAHGLDRAVVFVSEMIAQRRGTALAVDEIRGDRDHDGHAYQHPDNRIDVLHWGTPSVRTPTVAGSNDF